MTQPFVPQKFPVLICTHTWSAGAFVITVDAVFQYFDLMEASDGTIAKSAIALEDEEPSDSQHLKNRGRSNSPPWKKGLVYDCEEQTINFRSEKDISWSQASTIHAPR